MNWIRASQKWLYVLTKTSTSQYCSLTYFYCEIALGQCFSTGGAGGGRNPLGAAENSGVPPIYELDGY